VKRVKYEAALPGNSPSTYLRLPYPIAGRTIHISGVVLVTLNALPIFSSSSEHDTKMMRTMRDAKMHHPMSGKLAQKVILFCHQSL
jgi:hypothetical protein